MMYGMWVLVSYVCCSRLCGLLYFVVCCTVLGLLYGNRAFVRYEGFCMV